MPGFLFIDQPSQFGFPSDYEKKGDRKEDEDRELVKQIYRLVLEVAQELRPKFQIIMTDHADIDEDWFQDCVVEKWRGSKKLVPEEWL